MQQNKRNKQRRQTESQENNVTIKPTDGIVFVSPVKHLFRKKINFYIIANYNVYKY